ncbi:hypothetical protein FOA52_002973 [Chlamydomonas sp. UWO 241]|nr:hypothetical protein FOA52_002973 [Chlamydomonas sp. UWO 241]
MASLGPIGSGQVPSSRAGSGNAGSSAQHSFTTGSVSGSGGGGSSVGGATSTGSSAGGATVHSHMSRQLSTSAIQHARQSALATVAAEQGLDGALDGALAGALAGALDGALDVLLSNPRGTTVASGFVGLHFPQPQRSASIGTTGASMDGRIASTASRSLSAPPDPSGAASPASAPAHVAIVPPGATTASASAFYIAATAAAAAASGPPPAVVPAHHIPDFCSSLETLAALMRLAHTLLHSNGMQVLYTALGPVHSVYAGMHDLPSCLKHRINPLVASMRVGVMRDPRRAGLVAALLLLREHLFGASRHVLLLTQQGRGAVPLDLLLGSMSPQLRRIVGGALPPHVLDFFGALLPHPLLATLVFCEFVHVGPMPAGKGVNSGSDDEDESGSGSSGNGGGGASSATSY